MTCVMSLKLKKKTRNFVGAFKNYQIDPENLEDSRYGNSGHRDLGSETQSWLFKSEVTKCELYFEILVENHA